MRTWGLSIFSCVALGGARPAREAEDGSGQGQGFCQQRRGRLSQARYEVILGAGAQSTRAYPAQPENLPKWGVYFYAAYLSCHFKSASAKVHSMGVRGICDPEPSTLEPHSPSLVSAPRTRPTLAIQSPRLLPIGLHRPGINSPTENFDGSRLGSCRSKKGLVAVCNTVLWNSNPRARVFVLPFVPSRVASSQSGMQHDILMLRIAAKGPRKQPHVFPHRGTQRYVLQYTVLYNRFASSDSR